MKNSVYKLQGKVQHYQWGGVQYLPQLLRVDNRDQRPFAEYWLGGHDNAPSSVQMEPAKKLNEHIAENPALLGSSVANRFGRLPYLFKVLDVKDMLSIQVHPSKKAAEEAFEKENQAGVPINAANRNYKDDNHKPELMVALGDFYLLHGFKTADQIRSTLSAVPELQSLLPHFENGDYKTLYSFCMEMGQAAVDTLLQPLLDRIIPAYKEKGLSKNDPDFWAARAALTFNEPGRIDKGIFSIYLLNLVYLKEGEAIFQDAGVLHAYLEGQNMEIMANSDNVLRGGLTPKHIDVPELMKHIRFDATIPQVIHGTKRGEYEEVYRSPAPDFELSRFSFQPGNSASLQAGTTEIFIVMKGSVQFNSEEENISLHKGESAVAFADAEVKIEAREEAVLFRASVPV
ncbi:MAG: mannose-6-phosphate isomerase, class I [Williamsia sp.]|nr:mannose-6-phosphate isomerase, class I [Williamsia sp.]